MHGTNSHTNIAAIGGKIFPTVQSFIVRLPFAAWQHKEGDELHFVPCEVVDCDNTYLTTEGEMVIFQMITRGEVRLIRPDGRMEVMTQAEASNRVWARRVRPTVTGTPDMLVSVWVGLRAAEEVAQ